MNKKEYWDKHLGESWTEILKPLLKTPEFNTILDTLAVNYVFTPHYPEDVNSVFKAFKLCT